MHERHVAFSDVGSGSYVHISNFGNLRFYTSAQVCPFSHLCTIVVVVENALGVGATFLVLS